MENKKANPVILIPVAMLFLVMGILFDANSWVKYTLIAIAVVVCLISLLLALRSKRN